MRKTPERPATRVLGLGNPLMGDDGLGLAVLGRLARDWQFTPDVELADGGTWGMTLLPLIEDTDQLVILDAVRLGATPGTIHELSRGELPRYLSHKLSPHQIDLREVLALAELRGTMPRHVRVIGAEPASVMLRDALSAPLERRVTPLVLRTVQHLIRLGHRAEVGGECRTA